MSEALTFDRGFEVKTFATPEEKTIFALREYIIRTTTNIWLNSDILDDYFKIPDEEKRIYGLTHYFTHLSNGKMKLEVGEDSGLFFSKVSFLDDNGALIDTTKIKVPVGLQVSDIVGDSRFRLSDFPIVQTSDVSKTKSVSALFYALQKKYL